MNTFKVGDHVYHSRWKNTGIVQRVQGDFCTVLYDTPNAGYPRLMDCQLTRYLEMVRAAPARVTDPPKSGRLMV